MWAEIFPIAYNYSRKEGDGHGEMGHKYRVKSAECRASLWAAGMGSPPGSPYTVGVRGPTENQRNGIVEIFVFKTVGLNVRLQRRRGVPQARPSRPPGGQNFLLTVTTYVDLMRSKEITSVVHWRRQLQPGSNMPAGDFFVYIKNVPVRTEHAPTGRIVPSCL